MKQYNNGQRQRNVWWRRYISPNLTYAMTVGAQKKEN